MGKSVTLNVEQTVEIARDAMAPVYRELQELHDAPSNQKLQELDELLNELGLAQIGLEDIARNTIESYSGNESEYMEHIQVVNAKAADIYRYMNFDQIPAFVDVAATVEA